MLPIELISFTGADEGVSVRLDWSTASELNSSYFIVERSVDATAYEAIGSISAAGNSQSLRQYSLRDDRPLFGIAYYRLKQMDNDGAFEYFGPIAINRKGGGAIWIQYLPNEEIVVHGYEPNSASIALHDMVGRIQLLHIQANGHADVSALAAGAYVVSITQANGIVESMRFVVD